ncbi:hypothetical protein D9M71_325160 [compost metagenome]
MPEEQSTDQGDDEELFQQLVAEVFHGAVDQLAAVVSGDHLDALRQAFAQFVELGLHRGDGLAGVLAAAQDHHAADGLAVAIEFGDAAAHFRAELDVGDVAEGHRGAAGVELQRDLAEVVHRLQVAGGAHHELGLGQLQHAAAGLAVGGVDGPGDLLLGDAAAGHAHRIEDHLVLLDHPADGRHFGDVG